MHKYNFGLEHPPPPHQVVGTFIRHKLTQPSGRAIGVLCRRRSSNVGSLKTLVARQQFQERHLEACERSTHRGTPPRGEMYQEDKIRKRRPGVSILRTEEKKNKGEEVVRCNS